MRLDLLWLIPILVGHLTILVALANILHAFGHSEKLLGPVKIVLFSAMALGSVGWIALAWNHTPGSWPWPVFLYATLCVITGVLLFPAATTRIHFRSQPHGITTRARDEDLTTSDGRREFLGEGKYAWMLKLPGNESLSLRKTEGDLILPGLPAALDGLSVVHLSDFHLAPSFHRRYFEKVAEEAGAWESDLVLFTGDLVDHDDAVPWIVPILSRIRGDLGSFAILGNHDLEHEPVRLRRLLCEANFRDIEAQWTTLAIRGKTVAIGGTAFPWGHPLPLADRPRADFQILLSHSPDRFYWAEKAGFDLMFSGHNHGGQIRFPAIGPVFMPSVYSRRFDRGFFRKNGLTLHVSQGIASKHPIRYGCIPEISRFVLRSPSAVEQEPARASDLQANRPDLSVSGNSIA